MHHNYILYIKYSVYKIYAYNSEEVVDHDNERGMPTDQQRHFGSMVDISRCINNLSNGEEDKNKTKQTARTFMIKFYIYSPYMHKLHMMIKQGLTGGNWQKWKRVFLTCPCHKIYRDGAVGLKSCKYTWKITKFVKMGNLGQYRENLIFCQ